MFVTLALCALPASLHVDLPVRVTAQAPASNVETFVVPWVGARLGLLQGDDDAGVFKGFDGQLLVGLDQQGTHEVGVLRVSTLIEGRGLVGLRWRGGLVGVGGYGYASIGAGGGFALFNAFDDERLRPFGSWTLSGGGGVEFSFGSGFTRVEIGVGQRDLRLELSGTFGVGFVFSPAQ